MCCRFERVCSTSRQARVNARSASSTGFGHLYTQDLECVACASPCDQFRTIFSSYVAARSVIHSRGGRFLGLSPSYVDIFVELGTVAFPSCVHQTCACAFSRNSLRACPLSLALALWCDSIFMATDASTAILSCAAEARDASCSTRSRDSSSSTLSRTT